MTDKLDFGNSEDDGLNGFDTAQNPDGFALEGFDSATGATTVPAGVYLCEIEHGELAKTKAGKTAYRLRFKVAAPEKYAGFKLWRWFALGDAAGFNRAKAALAPFNFKTAADLRAEYPPLGESVYCKCLVTLKNDGAYGPSNDVQRFIPDKGPGDAGADVLLPPKPPAMPPTNRFAVSLGGEEGGSPAAPPRGELGASPDLTALFN